MYDDLSNKQMEILQYMKSQINLKGYPPSVREICEAVGLRSTSTVHGHLSKLEDKGYIRRDATKPRAIEILLDDSNDNFTHNKEMVNIPIIGKVTAGLPILAVENIEDTFPVPLEFIGNVNDKLFMLTIQGDSMIEAGIMNKDLVIVKQQSIAKNGDIVVALLDNEATVKRFFLEADHIRLQPENSSMEPIRVREATILGKVIGVFRKL